MKVSGDGKPPSTRPTIGRAQPVRVRAQGRTTETFSRFVRNLARLEGDPPPAGKGGEGGR